MIFVCSPYRGVTTEQTAAHADRARRYVAQLSSQGIPAFAPHLYYPDILDENDPMYHEMGMRLGLGFLRHCEAVHVPDDGVVSAGMDMELDFARRCNIPVRQKSF